LPALEDVLTREPGLHSQGLERFGTKGPFNLTWVNPLVGSIADPPVRRATAACATKPIDDLANATDNASNSDVLCLAAVITRQAFEHLPDLVAILIGDDAERCERQTSKSSGAIRVSLRI
jgi:hypothetical protein